MDLTDIFRTFHPNAEKYTFFSTAHGTFSRMYHILGHKSRYSKFKKSEFVSSIFSDHNAMRVGINYRKKKNCIKNANSLKNTLLNKEEATVEIRKIKRFPETNDNENMTT